MANFKARFPSTRLEQDDLKEDGKAFELRAVVATLAYEKVGEDQKTVIYFQGMDKGLVLNWTNACTLADLYGEDDDNWIGREVIIWVDPSVMYAGKRTGGLRLKGPPALQQATRRPGDIVKGQPAHKVQSGQQKGILDEEYEPPAEAR